MSYDLLVWEGDRPASDAAAAAVYRRVMDLLEQGDTVRPSDAVAGFVDALLGRWPDITTDAGDGSPWADGPLIANAFGSQIYFSMVWSTAEEASAFAAQLAADLGLVCYDPQSEQLRPAVIHSAGRWARVRGRR